MVGGFGQGDVACEMSHGEIYERVNTSDEVRILLIDFATVARLDTSPLNMALTLASTWKSTMATQEDIRLRTVF